jgi:hypothetical protein
MKGNTMNQLIRSAITTFVTAFVGLIPLSAFANQDFSWLQSALIAAALTTVRTLVAYLDPNNTAFGVGADPVLVDDAGSITTDTGDLA